MKRAKGAAAGQVRIIGGSLRGSVLRVADAPGLRPTPGRVRETLFNWLQPFIAGARCLDLFAGTGALGMEALSRGARAVTFVERDAAAARALQANLQRLNQDKGDVRGADAFDYLRGTASPFDIVFLDPPFAQALWDDAARQLEAGGWLARNALIHVESPVEQIPALPANWQLHRERCAGQVRHALYRRAAADPLD
ncbi:16S rRNA (guanine(966)-N(2))-methyltransferase RsmD [Oleiagrimonas sp. MCCC 1A03011]|uniref:16S rRNA (guanine(966)-N(2))-methyltransferase RsmD n=1 Tax=Oleiagrimonas sp. MCCC 1A03011 TaxID=1926883 RepID=UPI000DC4F8F2|nr:16S rRNA (guanine(966)-N(2))-methyltransferase RsmD [Oleiagrimonas sp. MCCC 1A03011]RAP59336.1 16S rRNA (guanine(966)-N(2))-methyltransferase RsmD [Oleiagrimonas sp. MCCC 1A03011]